MKKPELTEDQVMMIRPLRMLSKPEAAEVLRVGIEQVDKFRNFGLLKGTKTGKGWVYSQAELLAFQADLLGCDISSDADIINALKYRQ